MSADKISVGIVGIVGLPAKYGGFETLADNLVRKLGETFDIEVICSSKAYKDPVPSYLKAKLKYLPLHANGLSSILFDMLGIIILCLRRKKIVLVLGVSGAMILPLVKLFSQVKIVTNIDGLEWKRQKWSKLAKVYLRFAEALAVKYSDVVIADNQAIVEHIQTVYGKNSIKIAYGGDNNTAVKVGSLPAEVSRAGDYYLGICRIEPENNVHVILDAFKASPAQTLVFVGNWDASGYGKKLFQEFCKFPNIILLDPIYEPSLLHELRRKCVGYVHGHSAGGTNPSLVEMMHYNCRILAFDCSYNRFTLNNYGTYFNCFEELSVLVEKLRDKKALQDQDEISAVLSLAKCEYTWDKVSEKYRKLFYDLTL